MRKEWVFLPLWLAGCSSSGSSGANSDGDTCVLQTQLSGGVEATLGGGLACVYSSRSVAFAPLDGNVAVSLFVREIEAGQTGTFAADMSVSAGSESWTGAACSIDVESNVPSPSSYDAGMSFNDHLLKGKGSCSTLANYRGDAGTKPPVTIAPFTFTFHTLFY